MKMVALDTFHTSQTKTVPAGEEFEVASALGRELAKKGLAEAVGSPDEADDEPDDEPGDHPEEEPVPDDEPEEEPEEEPVPGREKMEEPPENKMITAVKRKRGRPPAVPVAPPAAAAPAAPVVEE
jgi:hypothetical protein